MEPELKAEYLRLMKARYVLASRVGKGEILDEVCKVCAMHRKSAVRALNASASSRAGSPKRPGPKRRYAGKSLMDALKAIWGGSRHPCGKRLVAAIALWLPSWENSHELDEGTRELLLQMSAATADRLLATIRKREGRSKSLTKPGSFLHNQVPVRHEPWDESRPGYMEADTVAHCGSFSGGDFVWSLTMTDIATGWTENRATWNKGAAGVCRQIEDIERSLPFELRGFDSDNGSEFLNHHLINYFSGRERAIYFTRSRPYHKNDQAHVEQKNWTHVRQLVGKERLDEPELVELMNKLYRQWSLLHNLFCPTMKLESKDRVGSKMVKRYGKIQTPAERVLASPEVSEDRKAEIQKLMNEIDPFALSKKLDVMVKHIHAIQKRRSKPRMNQPNPDRQTTTPSVNAR